MSYLGAFTNQMSAFSCELCEQFPEDADLKMAANMIGLIKKANPRKLVSLFDQFAEPLRDKIVTRDESFFLDGDFDYIGNENGKQEYTQTMITQLRVHWADMNEQSRRAAWDYFTVLFKLSDFLKESPQ